MHTNLRAVGSLFYCQQSTFLALKNHRAATFAVHTNQHTEDTVVCYKMENRPVGPFAFGSGMDFARDSANAAKVSATNQLLPLFRFPLCSPSHQTNNHQSNRCAVCPQLAGGWLKGSQGSQDALYLFVQVRGLKAIL